MAALELTTPPGSLVREIAETILRSWHEMQCGTPPQCGKKHCKHAARYINEPQAEAMAGDILKVVRPDGDPASDSWATQ
jgi:hypothetical protein